MIAEESESTINEIRTITVGTSHTTLASMSNCILPIPLYEYHGRIYTESNRYPYVEDGLVDADFQQHSKLVQLSRTASQSFGGWEVS